jgi:hypothetical protein
MSFGETSHVALDLLDLRGRPILAHLSRQVVEPQHSYISAAEAEIASKQPLVVIDLEQFIG